MLDIQILMIELFRIPLFAVLGPFGGDGTVEAIFISLIWLISIPIGGYVAEQKSRSMIEGILLGCLGPFGVLIEYCLPTLPAPPWDE